MNRSYFATAILCLSLFALISCGKKRMIINDEVKIILPEQRDSLQQLIAAFEERTGTEIGIYIFYSLDGRELADVSRVAFEKSGLAANMNKEGVLISMAMQERQMKMEVGSGLKELLPDERCEEIILKTMLPYYIKGRIFKGLGAGVDELIKTIESHKANSKPAVK